MNDLDRVRGILEEVGHRLHREWIQNLEEYLNKCVRCGVSFQVHRLQEQVYLSYPNSWPQERVVPCTKSFARLAKEAEEVDHAEPPRVYVDPGTGLMFSSCPRCGCFVHIEGPHKLGGVDE